MAYPSPPCFEHLTQLVFQAEKHASEIDIDDTVEFRTLQFRGLHIIAHDSGIVVGIVQSAEWSPP